MNVEIIRRSIATEDLIEIGMKAFRDNMSGKHKRVFASEGAMLQQILDRRRKGNPTHVVKCLDEGCRLYHPVFSDNGQQLLQAVSDFKEKHRGHKVEVSSVPLWMRDSSERGWRPNADVKEAFQSEQSMTVTNLHSLTNSATAGWSSASVDNSSNLYLANQVMVRIAAVNTAPGSDQAAYLYAYASTDGSIFTSTGTSGGTVGTEGTLTFPSVSTLSSLMPLVAAIPYPVQNKTLDAGAYNCASVFGGILPTYWGLAIINFTGFTFAASGNTVKYRGTYNTVI